MRIKKLEWWILHPFLFGGYPIISLLAHNIQETTIMLALRSFLFAFVLTLIILGISRIILRDWRKAAILTTSALLIFFTYGRIFSVLRTVHIWDIKFSRHRYLIIFCSLLLVGIGWLAAKRMNLKVWTLVLNITGILAVLIPGTKIIFIEASNSYHSRRQASAIEENFDQNFDFLQSENKPDIYYIILDTYTRSDAMLDLFDFDNTAFLDLITEKGFYVAPCSQSNYASTLPSLSSSLNLNYLSDISDAFQAPDTSDIDMFVFMQNNLVYRLFETLGYEMVAFDSGYSATSFTKADYYYSQNTDVGGALTIEGLNPFEVLVMETSAGYILYDYSSNHPELKVFFDYSYIEYRNRISYAMNKLPSVISLPGPKFVFVHLMAPHNPFVFGPDGEEIIRNFPFTLNNDVEVAYPQDYAAGYTDEVTYLNKRFTMILEQLITQSDDPPIIILQSDHGIPRFPDWNMTILNAYYFPDEQGQALLYPSISPVNSFRVVLNAYFGGHFEMLEDLACDPSNGNISECVTLPDPNPQCVQAKP